MPVVDPISDMLTRIRNALKAKKKSVDIPASKIKIEIAKIFQKHFLIDKFVVVTGEHNQGVLKILLKYDTEGGSVIQKLERVSKPGLRKYSRKNTIERAIGGLGFVILTTSQGIMTDLEAKRAGVGGEVLCRVW